MEALDQPWCLKTPERKSKTEKAKNRVQCLFIYEKVVQRLHKFQQAGAIYGKQEGTQEKGKRLVIT
jgi:competence transcription factor ComK